MESRLVGRLAAIGVLLTSAQGWDFVRSHETTPIGHAQWLAAHEAAR